ncbi:hypothetical protein ACRS7P_25455 [Pseudomonas aeruginosa]|uniref:hypothetical protein n=1 Tax=Pseudomonas aeruginosa TaxID=287 RepID=UPI00330C2B91|nr:hypothetical protein [Klebsiella pneumoniae]
MYISFIDTTERQVVNQTPFGQAIAAIAAHAGEVLHEAGHGFGWHDGGCRIFAEALQTWSEGFLQLGCSGRDQAGSPSHFFAVLETQPGLPYVCIDADGAALEHELLEKIRFFEMSNESIIAVYPGDAPVSAEIVRDPGVSAQVAALCSARIGPFSGWRGDLVKQGIAAGQEYLADSAADAERMASIYAMRL